MPDSDDDDVEIESAEFMSTPEITEFLEEAEEEKEQLQGRSGKHWKPMVFEEIFEPAETTHFPSGFQPRTRTIPQEHFSKPASCLNYVYGELWQELVVASNVILAAKYPGLFVTSVASQFVKIIDIIFAIPVQKKIEVKLFFFIAQKIFILCKL